MNFKTIAILWIINLILITSASFGQIKSNCDHVYTFLETMPEHKDGEAGVTKFIMKEISPVISEYNKHYENPLDRLKIDLIIDKKGKIADVIFPEANISTDFQNIIRKKLILMQGWNAGKMNGKPVCCQLTFPISCILYN